MTIEERVLSCFAEIGHRPITLGETIDSLGFESLQLLHLVYLLEQYFEVSIPDSFIFDVKTTTVQDVVNYVTKHAGEAVC